ncbi:MAG TPA: GMC family oxidoreductase [Steroidobacteraceae bacterium]|nr:GMC family oxidoreductase [Steroidobacteraceae bacterium]
MTTRTYDVCIIGAGVAGALVAAEAVRRGRTVVMIEAGRRFDIRDRYAQLRHFQNLGGDPWPWYHEGRDGFVDSSYESIGFQYHLEHNRMKGVGGTTLHWEGRARRLMPSDFRTRSTYGLGMDWPFGYEELEPFYSQAEWELGVAGEPGDLDPPRSRPFPMPGFPISVDEAHWAPVAERLGVPLCISAFAINSQPYAGRGECAAIGACQICPSGARYSADHHVAKAEASGLCTLLSETVARRIKVDRSGRVRHVQATTMGGADLEIRAETFVLSAHSIESARLLLLSGLGNQSGQVGRNLSDHVYAGTGGYARDRRFYPYRVGYEKLESLFWYDGEERRERGAIKLEFTFEIDPLQELKDGRLWGTAMALHDRESFGHWLGVAAETEWQPNPDSRVTLHGTRKDMFGDPVPHVRLAFSQTDLRTQARARQIGTWLLNEFGAQDVHPLTNWFGSHQMGTCRMADDPARGVVDRDCRVHGIENLHLAGASVFPTSGAVQPTLTIAALSLRLALHLFGPA